MNTTPINSLTRCKPLLGTFVDVSLSGELDNDELIVLSNTVFNEIERIQSLMSFHDPLSELSLLNKSLLINTNQPHEISTDLYNVLTLALRLNNESNGYYDIAIAPHLVKNQLLPDHLALMTNTKHQVIDDLGTSNDVSLYEEKLNGSSNNNERSVKYLTSRKAICFDLGGIAKGYAVDCAISKIPSNIEYTINAGGDMRMSHFKAEHVALKYGKRSQAIKPVIMQKPAVASSGLYHQGVNSHIFNPKKVNKKKQMKPHKFGGVVTVFANTAMLADALTKVVILMNKEQSKKILKHFDASAVVINRFGFMRNISTK